MQKIPDFEECIADVSISNSPPSPMSATVSILDTPPPQKCWRTLWTAPNEKLDFFLFMLISKLWQTSNQIAQGLQYHAGDIK